MKIGVIFDLKSDYTLNIADSDDFTSLDEVVFLMNTLIEMGHTACLLQSIDFISQNISYIKQEFDLIINLIEGNGSRNREALVPALLEINGIRYIGSDCFANIVCLDKHLTKLVVRDCGIKTPKSSLYLNSFASIIGEIPNTTNIVLKPVNGGSSDGITLVQRENPSFISIVKGLSSKFEQNILIEEYVEGSDYSVSMYGNPNNGYKIIGAVKIIDNHMKNLILYDKKYKKNFNVTKIYPDWADKIKNGVYESCIKIAKTLNLSGFFRLDFRVSDDDFVFLEVNTIPSFLELGSFRKAIELNNVNFKEILKELLNNENIKSTRVN
ncbi:MAG: ATP-grasp domain-containing protein [Erysipelotrichales bacterium]|nr:ATP-grasp domain-containing protein [Erysipelotrichales bacterium]